MPFPSLSRELERQILSACGDRDAANSLHTVCRLHVAVLSDSSTAAANTGCLTALLIGK